MFFYPQSVSAQHLITPSALLPLSFEGNAAPTTSSSASRCNASIPTRSTPYEQIFCVYYLNSCPAIIYLPLFFVMRVTRSTDYIISSSVPSVNNNCHLAPNYELAGH